MDTFREKWESAIREEIRSGTRLRESIMGLFFSIPRLNDILSRIDALPSSDDVQSVRVLYSYSDEVDAEVFIRLKEDRGNSPFVRDLARLFHLTLEKGQEYHGRSLQAKATHERVHLTVRGYVPSTCEIVEEEVEVPAHRETKRKIVCVEEEA